MRAARFFIDAPLASNIRIELPPRVAHHAARVLRLRAGESIVVFNGLGGEFAARFTVDDRRAFAAIGAFDPIEREAPLAITLVQSFITTEMLDWVVEKAVELGVHSIMLAPAQRSVVRLANDRLARRLERLRESIIAACAQCGRNRIPQIAASTTLAAALQTGLDDEAHGVLLQPNAELPLVKAPLMGHRVALAVGPEGGFDDDERALAQRLGYREYHLGPRVLRTETAGLAALAALQAAAGDFA